MKLTNSLKLKKPDGSDFYDVENFNYNADVIDEELEKVNSAIGQMAYQLVSESEIDNMEPITGLPVGGGGDLGDATPIQNSEIDNVLIN